MTVIVYRAGILAADRGIFHGATLRGLEDKILRRADGALCATAGNTDDGVAFEQWFLDMGRGDKPKLDNDSFGAITVAPDGSAVQWFAACVPTQAPWEYIAIGGGEDYAYGALAAGATAEQAVEATLKHYIYSRGPVQVERAGLAHRLVAVV